MSPNYLWKNLRPAAFVCCLLEVAVREGFIADRRGEGNVIVGVNAREWIHECQGQFGSRDRQPRPGRHPVLRALHLRLCWLSQFPFSVVFVFDGPARPKVRPSKAIRHIPQDLVTDFKRLIALYRFHVYEAPGDSGAELAQMNKIGAVDFVITSDSNSFIFGAVNVIKSPATFDRPSWKLIELYTSARLQQIHAEAFSTAGFLMMAIVCGGDYSKGLPGCREALGFALAAGPLSAQLYNAAAKLRGQRQDIELQKWREALQHELRHDPAHRLGRTYPWIANAINNEFPNRQALTRYCFPVTSGNTLSRLPINQWKVLTIPRVIDIAVLCARVFGWSGNLISKLVNTGLLNGVFIRHLVKDILGAAIPPNTPLGPDQLRHVTVIYSPPWNRDYRTFFPQCRVEIWTRSATIPAFNAVDQALGGIILAPGNGSIVSTNFHVPYPILVRARADKIQEYQDQNRRATWRDNGHLYQRILI